MIDDLRRFLIIHHLADIASSVHPNLQDGSSRMLSNFELQLILSTSFDYFDKKPTLGILSLINSKVDI